MPMTRRKPRAVELLELGALVAGGGLLVYYSCREPSPNAGAEAPRERRTFAAARGEGEGEPVASDAVGRRKAVEEAVRELIGGVALGQVDELQRPEAQRALVALLERLQWGSEQNRSTAAAVIVQQVFDQAKARSSSEVLSPQ